MDTVYARRLGLLISILLPAFAMMAFAASGTSSISFNQTNATVSIGSKAMIAYTVSLVNGSTGLTNFTINNRAALASQDINVNASVAGGDPTYAGILSIQAGPKALPGRYTVLVTAMGLAPSKTSAAMPFTIPGNAVQPSGVPPPQTGKTNKTFPATGPVTLYTTANTTSAVTTMPAGQQSSSGWTTTALLAVVIAAIIVIGAFLVLRARARPKQS